MHSKVLNITFDCADARAQAFFWAAAIGGTATEMDSTPGQVEYAVESESDQMPRLYFTTVPEPKRSKNKIHLDLLPQGGDQAAELARLTNLGARKVGGQPDDAGWVIMVDPENNEFCLEPSPG